MFCSGKRLASCTVRWHGLARFVVAQRNVAGRVRSAGVAALTALVLLASGCTSSRSGSRTYRLWSDGWRPGVAEHLAAIAGPFHARMEHGVVCAWLDEREQPTRWPAAWKVRLDPTVLLDPAGHVVAHDGDRLVSAGGGDSWTADAHSPCGPAGSEVTDLQGKITSSTDKPRTGLSPLPVA